jgi:uncharacterized membrane protein
MTWLWVLAGAFAGAMFGAADREFFGLLVGALLGYGAAQFVALRRRVTELERDLAVLQTASVRATLARPPAAAAAAESAAAATAAGEAPAAAPASPGWATPPPPPPRTAAARTAAPPRSALDSLADNALYRAVRDWFMGGNTLVRVGVVVLFFGVAFLLAYVAERTSLAMQYRLAGVAAGAIVLLVLGWRLRRRRAGYALALQGGAVGILYLTTFAALRLYALLPPAAAFALLVAITVFAVMLAVLQDSLAFAMLAAAGGFLAPVLASSGQGDHVVLFSYYAVLNAGLVAIAWFKAWRPLPLLGFAFTFLIATVWGVLRYRPALFASTEPFLVLHFLMYVAIAVLFALRQPPQLRGYVDGTLVFGVPVAAFALQTALLREHTAAGGLGLAFSALAVGALYVLLAAWLWRAHRDGLRLLTESFLALGIAFLTLAVPLALDGHWTAAVWALEGAALVWVGGRQQRRLPRAAGLLLQLGAGWLFALRGEDVAADAVAVLNSGFLGGLMVAGAAGFSALQLERVRERLASWERPAIPVVFVWGALWGLVAGALEATRVLEPPHDIAAFLLWAAFAAAAVGELARRGPLPVARWGALALIPLAVLLALTWRQSAPHPFAGFGAIAWIVTFVVLARLLRQHAGEGSGWSGTLAHAATLWLFALVLMLESVWLAGRATGGVLAWIQLAEMAAPCALLVALPWLTRRIDWPFVRHARAYQLTGGSGLALYLVLWLLAVNFTASGDPAPLAYLPLANPLDLASGLVVFALARQARVLPLREPRWAWGALAVLGFVWLNAALLRAVHHLGGVPFEPEALARSTLVQVSLSIFWTVLALGCMLLAKRGAGRVVWLVGGALLAVVVAKLFLVDLSRVGTIERIVSFVVVGVLMLVIGYYSPLPPPRDRAAREGGGSAAP